MRERPDRAGVPAIQEHGGGRGLGTVALVTAGALLVAGAVTGWVLIGADGSGNAAAVSAADSAGAQGQAEGRGGADGRDGGGESDEKPPRMPPFRIVVPPIPTPDEQGERGPERSSGERSPDENRQDSSDQSDGSDRSNGSDGSDGTDERRTSEPDPEPSPEPEPEPEQPKPRVAVLTTEAEYGFATGVRITNEGEAPLTWTMRLTYDDVQVTGGWQADVTQSGSEVTIRGMDRTATIPPGEQALFGYHLTGRAQEPTGCTLNGEPCRLITQ